MPVSTFLIEHNFVLYLSWYIFCPNAESVYRKSMTEYDPRLVAPACLYLASKVEESTVQARLLVFYIKKMCGESWSYTYEVYMEELH